MKDYCISIIVNSCDDKRYDLFLTRFLKKINIANVDVIRIADAVSMSEGYNRGAKMAKGSWYIFCHDDIALVNGGIKRKLKRMIKCADVFGVCGTKRIISGNWYDGGIPYNAGSVVVPNHSRKWKYRLEIFGISYKKTIRDIQALDGLFIVCSKKVFDSINGFDEISYKDFHTYDIDFTFRAYLAGYRCAVINDLLLQHDSDVSTFSIEKNEAWRLSQNVFIEKYGRYIAKSGGERRHYNISLKRLSQGRAKKMLFILKNIINMKKNTFLFSMGLILQSMHCEKLF
jgi:GT2 family glycosyltransferase